MHCRPKVNYIAGFIKLRFGQMGNKYFKIGEIQEGTLKLNSELESEKLFCSPFSKKTVAAVYLVILRP